DGIRDFHVTGVQTCALPISELAVFENELNDRFGALPPEARNLLKSVELKWLAAEVGFDKLIVKNGVFLGYFPANPQDKFYQSDKIGRASCRERVYIAVVQ